LSMLTKMVVAGLVTVLLFLVGKPTKRLWQMVETSVGAMSSNRSSQQGLFSRFRKNSTEPTAQDQFWRTMRGGDGADADRAGAQGRARPEATVQATAQRLDRQYSPGTHPASTWTGGAHRTPEVAGGARSALPPGGTAAASATFPMHGRAGSEDAATAAGGRRQGGAASRTVDTSPVADRSWGQGDEPDPVVVPSRVAGSHDTTPQTPRRRANANGSGGHLQQAAAAAPRRAESEMVAGRPVHVLYRPSQGLEVRQDMRDTDRAVR